MELGLADKVALVGGGGRGLGRAAAEVLVTEGAAVAIFARDVEALAVAASVPIGLLIVAILVVVAALFVFIVWIRRRLAHNQSSYVQLGEQAVFPLQSSPVPLVPNSTTSPLVFSETPLDLSAANGPLPS